MNKYMYGDNACKVVDIIDKRRKNKRWQILKEQGNEYFRSKNYDEAMNLYIDSFFIAGGMKSSYKLLYLLFGREKKESALHRVSSMPGLLSYVLQYVEYNFLSNQFDVVMPLPNAGVGITCSNIAQCLLNKHSINYKIRNLDEDVINSERSLLNKALQWLQLSLNNLPYFFKSYEREIEVYKRLLVLAKKGSEDYKNLNSIYKSLKDDYGNMQMIASNFDRVYMVLHHY